MTTGTIPFVRVPSKARRPLWSRETPDDMAFHELGKQLVGGLVAACRRAGWTAEDHGEWEVRDPRWDPDLRVNLVIGDVAARIYVLPPTKLHPAGEILVEVEGAALRADLVAVVRGALASFPDIQLDETTAASA